MFLFYVYSTKRNEFILWDSVPWSSFNLDRVKFIYDEINDYIADEIPFPDVKTFELNLGKFIHDLILYKQYFSTCIRIYYIDMPVIENG